MTDDDFKVFGIREPISSFDECGSGRGLTEGLCTQLAVHIMLLIYKIIQRSRKLLSMIAVLHKYSKSPPLP